MVFSVAYNWDPALIEFASEHGVTEIFCKFDRDVTGGARPAFALKPAGWADLRRTVDLARNKGVAINYVLNGVGNGAREFTPRFRTHFDRFVGRLTDMGVGLLTVSSPHLLEAARRAHPEIKCVVSTLAHVDNLSAARHWERIGADIVILEDVRDPGLIRAIRKHTCLEVELIANHLCWPGCPLKYLHSEVSSNASANGSVTGRYYPQYCDAWCQLLRLTDPSAYIKASWIRPQDLDRYEEWGVTRIKICERIALTEDMCRIIEAYESRKYNGNLVDLFPKMLAAPSKPKFRVIRGTGVGRFVTVGTAGLIKRAYAKPKVTIDSSSLDGFLDFFETNNCRTLDCSACGHCERFAGKAVTIEDASEITEAIKALLDKINSGAAFTTYPTSLIRNIVRRLKRG